MIFHPDIAAAVLAGRATQVIRRVRAGETAPPLTLRHGTRHTIERRLTDPEVKEAGVDVLLAVQEGRMQRPVTHLGFLIVESARRARLSELTFADIARMGYSSTAAFQAAQVMAHDGLWRHRLRQVPEGHPDWVNPSDPAVLAERFREHHAGVPVWLVRFRVDRDASPRYLAARSELGYVPAEYDRRGRRVAMEDEPEAVDETTQRKLSEWGRAADLRRRDEQAAALAGLPLVERVRRLEQARGGADVSSDLRVIASRTLRALRRRRSASAATPPS